MPQPKTLLVFALIFFSSGCAYYNTLFNAKGTYNEGIKALRESPNKQTTVPTNARQHFETTIEKCWKLIDIYSDKSKYADDALLYIAKSEFHLKRYGQAMQHLEQFMAKYADSDLIPEAQLWYGKVLLQEQDIEKANEFFRLVIANSKNGQIRSQASYELGMYAFQQKDYQQTIEYLKRALQENLEDDYKAQVLYSLGEAYFRLKDYKSAISQYEKVEKQSPTPDIEYNAELQHARALSLTGKPVKAREMLRKMLTAPRFKNYQATIKTEIGRIYEQEEDILNAVDTYNEVIAEKRNDEGTAWAAYHLAQIYENTIHNLDSAVFYYRRVPQIYSRFDSLDYVKRKDQFLGEFKNILDNIHRDEHLVDRLSNDPDFMDSLYTAQYEDSFRIANGLAEDDTTSMDSLLAVMQADTARSDSFLLGQNNQTGVTQDPFADNTQTRNVERTQPQQPGDLDPNSEFQGLKKDPLTSFDNRNLQPTTTKPAANTTTKPKKKLEKRKLPRIEFDLMNSRYQLAEFFLLKEENYDSAAHHYEMFIETYEDSILTPKAYYSLIYIYRSPKHRNLEKVYELEKELLTRYMQSPFALEVMKNMGIYEERVPELTPREKAYQDFLKAESLYFAGRYRPAIDTYQKVANLDSTWDISAKAQYALAWVYEKDLGMTDSAFTAYERVVQRFPKASQYVTAARKKISPPQETTAVTDTTNLAENGQDTPTDVASKGESENGSKPVIGIGQEDILKEKIRWRNLRESR